MKEKIKIAITEDHVMFRQTLASYLKKNEEFQVILEASNGIELLKKIEDVKPDVLLLDISMPVMGGHDTLVYLTKHYPDIRVIMISSHSEEFYIVDFLTRGAKAYVPKHSSPEALKEAIISVHHLGFYSTNLSEEVMKMLLEPDGATNEIELTRTERKVAQLLLEDKTSREASTVLSTSNRTVEWHRSNILTKTNSKSISDLKRWPKESLLRLFKRRKKP